MGWMPFPLSGTQLGAGASHAVDDAGLCVGGRYSWNWLQRGRLRTDQGPGGERSPEETRDPSARALKTRRRRGEAASPEEGQSLKARHTGT